MNDNANKFKVNGVGLKDLYGNYDDRALVDTINSFTTTNGSLERNLPIDSWNEAIYIPEYSIGGSSLEVLKPGTCPTFNKLIYNLIPDGSPYTIYTSEDTFYIKDSNDNYVKSNFVDSAGNPVLVLHPGDFDDIVMPSRLVFLLQGGGGKGSGGKGRGQGGAGGGFLAVVVKTPFISNSSLEYPLSLTVGKGGTENISSTGESGYSSTVKLSSGTTVAEAGGGTGGQPDRDDCPAGGKYNYNSTYCYYLTAKDGGAGGRGVNGNSPFNGTPVDSGYVYSSKNSDLKKKSIHKKYYSGGTGGQSYPNQGGGGGGASAWGSGGRGGPGVGGTGSAQMGTGPGTGGGGTGDQSGGGANGQDGFIRIYY